MRALFDLFWEICLLRKGPQDVPASQVLLKLSLLTYGLSGLLIMRVNMAAATAVLETLLDMVLLTAMTYEILRIRGYRLRFVQTLTALTGTGTLLGLIALPVSVWMRNEAGSGTQLPSLLFLGLLGWNVAVMAHVLRHALSTSQQVGLLWAVGYFIVLFILSNLLVVVN